MAGDEGQPQVAGRVVEDLDHLVRNSVGWLRRPFQKRVLAPSLGRQFRVFGECGFQSRSIAAQHGVD